jgi:hypothetical protein
MSKQQLHSAKVAGPPVDQHTLVLRSECVPNFAGSRPIQATHS